MDNTNCVRNIYDSYGELVSCDRICDEREFWDVVIMEDGGTIEFIPDCTWKKKVDELENCGCKTCTSFYEQMESCGARNYGFKCPHCNETLISKEYTDEI